MVIFFVAQTWVGRGIAGILLILAVLPVVGYLVGRSSADRLLWGRCALCIGLLAAAIMALVLLQTPTGCPEPDSPVSHRFTTGRSFPRYPLTNVIPEIEQINAGFWVIPYLDPIITRAQARRVSAFTLNLYREIERDPHFRRLGSAMGFSYAELAGRPFDVGHYYLYVPRNRGQEPLPVVLFLHGSGGNFKAYMWVWSKLAEEMGIVIVSPSFGFGNWRQPGGVDAVFNALDDAQQVVAIDETRVYLAGLSNGGLGVSLTAMRSPQRFRGLILISPVMATEVVDREPFVRAWAGRPVLAITGATDRRVPVNYVARRISIWKNGGVEVTYAPYMGEDHFLFFSQPVSVLGDIRVWMAGREE